MFKIKIHLSINDIEKGPLESADWLGNNSHNGYRFEQLEISRLLCAPDRLGV